MIIEKTRVNSLPRYLRSVPDGARFAIGVRVTPEIQERLEALGFSGSWVDGEILLPPASEGPACRRNAEGWEIVHRDQPKETAYREFEWSWTEYHGPYEHEESRIVYQPYERYPRTRVAPPSLEISTVSTPRGRMLVVVTAFENGRDLTEAKLAVNILLELFGEAEILGEDLSALVPNTLRRVNWEVLPRGEHPWSTLEPAVQDVLACQGERKRPVYEHRWKTISAYGPEFVAVGRAGFSGYLIFSFPTLSLYILESAYYGNATYVLDRDWETLSSMTKAELLDASLHKERIIHWNDWDRRVHDLLGEQALRRHW